MNKVLLFTLVFLLSCSNSSDNKVLLDIIINGPKGGVTKVSDTFLWGKSKTVTPKGYKLTITPSVENKSEIRLKVIVNYQTKLLGKTKLTTIFNYPATINIENADQHYKVQLIPRKLPLK